MAIKSRRSPSHTSIPPSPADAPTPALVGDADSNADANAEVDAEAEVAVKVPRPPNAWILYRSDKVRELELRAGPSKPRRPQAEISKEISIMWKEELPEVKAGYEKAAAIKKAIHAAKYPDYRFKPQKKEAKQREKELVKAQKAKARKEAGGCKRTTKARRVTSSPKSDRSPKSPTPGLDPSLLPPFFTMGPPEGTSPSDIFDFDTAIPPSTFSAMQAPVPQQQSPPPVASTSQLQTYDLTSPLDANGNLDLNLLGPPDWLLNAPFDMGNMDFSTWQWPSNSVIPAPSDVLIPSGWQPGEDTLDSQAHPATLALAANVFAGSSDGRYLLELSDSMVGGHQIGLTFDNPSLEKRFEDQQGFAGSLLDMINASGSDSQGLQTHDSPASQPTPALTYPTPAAPSESAHAAWNSSPSHASDASLGPSTPPFFPRHADNSVYVPPTGATYAGSRRVGGSWAPAINAR